MTLFESIFCGTAATYLAGNLRVDYLIGNEEGLAPMVGELPGRAREHSRISVATPAVNGAVQIEGTGESSYRNLSPDCRATAPHEREVATRGFAPGSVINPRLVAKGRVTRPLNRVLLSGLDSHLVIDGVTQLLLTPQILLGVVPQAETNG